ncbi:uncharacterized protein J3R85_011966 [Psidium guajava]|nr:uncharacterized protein J3R85_011966 [Psidium guajava]
MLVFVLLNEDLGHVLPFFSMLQENKPFYGWSSEAFLKSLDQ